MKVKATDGFDVEIYEDVKEITTRLYRCDGFILTMKDGEELEIDADKLEVLP